MEVQLIGITRMYGKGKASNKDYDMHRALFLAPMNDFDNETTHRRTLGYEQMEIDVKPEAWAKFSELKFPCKAFLTIENEPRAGKLIPVAAAVKAL